MRKEQTGTTHEGIEYTRTYCALQETCEIIKETLEEIMV